jgi:hypothetical protein
VVEEQEVVLLEELVDYLVDQEVEDLLLTQYLQVYQQELQGKEIQEVKVLMQHLLL